MEYDDELDSDFCECRVRCGNDCDCGEYKRNWVVPVSVAFVVGFGVAVLTVKYRRELAGFGLTYGSEAKKLGKKKAKKIEKIVKKTLNEISK